jgi:outer membrane protein assembly factor BamE (lipoprotein component of BamABCDE complex)
MVPIPTREKVLAGTPVNEEQISFITPGITTQQEVIERLGEPIIDFGPRRVFVYTWAIRYGVVFWALAGMERGVGGMEPLITTYLLFIAFDPDCKVLETANRLFKPFETIGGQVRDWLTSCGLATQFVDRRPGDSTGSGPVLFVYRPSHSPCTFPRFDANIFKPSVAVDGVVVGDLAKGEYLISEINVGAHTITIDPIPYYSCVGRETSSFAVHGIPTTVKISVEPEQPTYVEAYLCTGTGNVEMNAVIRDAPTALKAMSGLQPSW